MKGNSDQAIIDYTKAMGLDHNLAEAYHNRGSAFGSRGNTGQAIVDYTKAIELNPDYAEAYSNRARAYYAKQEYAKAWDDLYKAKELGRQIDTEFIDELRKSSGRKN